MLKKVSWQDLLDRLRRRLASWTLKPLNLPSRLILVKHVLQAMPVYLFSLLSAPKSVLKDIRGIQRTFLWGGREEKSKFSLVSWDKICRPKMEGGLGLRDPETLSGVFGSKIWWRWCTYSNEPWARLWHIKYARERPVEQLIRFNMERNGSHIWKKAWEGRLMVQSHCFWEIRSGEDANFWEDSWNQLSKLSSDP